ncbi:DUF2974 domain-containing protein [Sinanaerobacter sp. ZZT-01]|uniref:DUF2974 domain-containing protein n=1 Tax=Sinanaerobacter sp. ZZT-01 TaxID=3111540 RepID=UPI002D787215|nr:DUF2974 domain-containing protein [Sinanaerobacter sp. ZZT-01]WRR93032.1 DUF2974 domain-containing protein [Sinanaerobacter sp. ZZT-01]
MKNIVDYVSEFKEDFCSKPFNAIDSLVLSQLSYLYFDGIVSIETTIDKAVRLKDIKKNDKFDEIFHNVRDSESNQKLLRALIKSPRFKDTKLCFYVNNLDYESEKQFSAITFLINDGTAYLAYRGTDASFVGWKEDFNMAFLTPVPSQEEAVSYLNFVGSLLTCDFKVGGHSKGGNLAVYSAVKCESEVQKKITHVYSHDGPGFRENVFSQEEYDLIKERIYKTLPESALVGMLLQNMDAYSVVKSNRIGILQHDPFSWSVKENDFQYVKTVASSAVLLNKAINSWLNSLDDEKRKMFIESLYQIVKVTEAKTFYDLTDNWQQKAITSLSAIKDIDDETRLFIRQAILSLIHLAMQNLKEEVRRPSKD